MLFQPLGTNRPNMIIEDGVIFVGPTRVSVRLTPTGTIISSDMGDVGNRKIRFGKIRDNAVVFDSHRKNK